MSKIENHADPLSMYHINYTILVPNAQGAIDLARANAQEFMDTLDDQTKVARKLGRFLTKIEVCIYHFSRICLNFYERIIWLALMIIFSEILIVMEILNVTNIINFGQKSKFCSKIEFLFKNRNFEQTSKFWSKINNFDL